MGCIPLQKGRRSVWAQRLVVRIVVYAHIPRRRGEGRGGVGVRVHSGYREARVAFTLGAHPGVQVGGQHLEESVAGRGTHLGPPPRCRAALSPSHFVFDAWGPCWRRGGRPMNMLVITFGVVIVDAMVVVDVVGRRKHGE